MESFFGFVGFMVAMEGLFFLVIFAVLAFYTWRFLLHIWKGTAFTAYHIENETLYIHNLFETVCPLSDIKCVEAQAVTYRKYTNGAKYFVRLYRKTGGKIGMIIGADGIKYYSEDRARRNLEDFFKLMEAHGISCKIKEGGSSGSFHNRNE